MRNRRKPANYLWIGALVLVLAVLGGLGYANFRYVEQNPGGNDFLVHWMGTKNLINNGVSPYSDETALLVQNAVYGRPARAGEQEFRMAYPLYSIIVFLPFALSKDFIISRAAWMTLLEVSLVLMAFLSLLLVRWKPGLGILALFYLFSMIWYHATRPLVNGNAVILVALLLVSSLLAIRYKADELAGVLLAFSTIKPQIVILVLVYILIWAIGKWRWKLISWFFVSLVVLSASAALLVPDWILQNIREVLRYPEFNPLGSPGAAIGVWVPWLGKRIGYAISALVGITLFVEWIIHRKADFKAFLWTVCLTLVLSQWSGIHTDPGNFIIVFPAIPLVMSGIQDRWHAAGNWVNLILILFFSFGIWGIFLGTLTPGELPVQSPVMFFPLLGILLLGMIWIRWWATHRQINWIDQFEEE